MTVVVIALSVRLSCKDPNLESHRSKTGGQNKTGGSELGGSSSGNGDWVRSAGPDWSLGGRAARVRPSAKESGRVTGGDGCGTGDVGCGRRCVGNNGAGITQSRVRLSTRARVARSTSARAGIVVVGVLVTILGGGDRSWLRDRNRARTVGNSQGRLLSGSVRHIRKCKGRGRRTIGSVCSRNDSSPVSTRLAPCIGHAEQASNWQQCLDQMHRLDWRAGALV